MPAKPGRFDFDAMIGGELGKTVPDEDSGATPLKPDGFVSDKSVERGATVERREKTIEELLAEATEKASDRLRAAIIGSSPERLESETENAAIEAELRRVMTDLQEIPKDEDYSNRPIVARLEGRGTPAVYKPVEREVGNQPVIETISRFGIPPGTHAKREWLAFLVDRALGLGIVPTVVLRDGPYGLGSVQDWRNGDKAFDRKWLREADQDERIMEQLARVGLFDAAVRNTDRMSHNWLISSEGKHWAIDNSLILPTETGCRQVEEAIRLRGRTRLDFSDSLIVSLFKNRDKLRCYPLWAVGNKPLPDHLADLVRKFLGAAEVRGTLRGAFDLALEEESEEAWNGFIGRLEKILKDGLPENEWTGDDYISLRFR